MVEINVNSTTMGASNKVRYVRNKAEFYTIILQEGLDPANCVYITNLDEAERMPSGKIPFVLYGVNIPGLKRLGFKV